MSNKTLIKSIVVLTVICLVISGALAVVNSFTAPIIEAAAIERETASRQQVLPVAADFEELSKDSLPASVTSAYKGVDASGATITSTAYEQCVQDAFTAYDAVKEG